MCLAKVKLRTYAKLRAVGAIHELPLLLKNPVAQGGNNGLRRKVIQCLVMVRVQFLICTLK